MGEITVFQLLERILDSPYECDKWRMETEKMYIRMGGDKKSLVAPTLRERMAAKLEETNEKFNSKL